jgi:hypothetical protein
MLIAIPSKARATRQVTLLMLPPEIRKQVYLVVPTDEIPAYRDYELPILGVDTSGIGAARQTVCDFALGLGQNKVLMLDDDLVFATRRTDDPTKFRTSVDAEIIEAVKDIELSLNMHAHAAIAPREGGNRRTDRYVENTRALRALAYRVDILQYYGIRFDAVELMEDFYVQLSLLTRGCTHRTINWIVQNQGGSNSAGGCSTYRTMEKQSAAAHALKAAFPDFVSVVKKITKTAWQGQEREDVIIQWKAAFEYGSRRCGERGPTSTSSLLDQGTTKDSRSIYGGGDASVDD